ncbi:MAG: Uma2 family endonuclease [Planctomycetota bacterium]|nr:MAG: Uma2 family endonuclease [Planctomycetota bacterium]
MSVADPLTTQPIVPTSAPSGVPRLQNGDRLTRIEFERRYLAMPEVKKAELIEGIVYMPSPVRIVHGEPHATLAGWIVYYASKAPGLRFADNSTCRLDGANEPQPDLMLMLPASAGGAARIDEDNYVSGSPELVCEIAASSVSIDLHAKKNAYERNGVQDYIVWRIEDGAIDWFELVDGRFQPLAADEKGRFRSKAFPGLWLDAPAMLSRNLAKVFAAVDEGTSTPEHAAFAKRLAEAASRVPQQS